MPERKHAPGSYSLLTSLTFQLCPLCCLGESSSASAIELADLSQKFLGLAFRDRNMRSQPSLKWPWVVCLSPDQSLCLKMNLWLTVGSGKKTIILWSHGCVSQTSTDSDLCHTERKDSLWETQIHRVVTYEREIKKERRGRERRG